MAVNLLGVIEEIDQEEEIAEEETVEAEEMIEGRIIINRDKEIMEIVETEGKIQLIVCNQVIIQFCHIDLTQEVYRKEGDLMIIENLIKEMEITDKQAINLIKEVLLENQMKILEIIIKEYKVVVEDSEEDLEEEVVVEVVDGMMKEEVVGIIQKIRKQTMIL